MTVPLRNTHPVASASVGARLAQMLVSTEAVSRAFVHRRATLFRKARIFDAVRGVSFDLAKGETLGIVGESGCGKSTLGSLVAGLIPPTAGRVLVDGVDLGALPSHQWRESRRRVQIIFQDAPGSLDPRIAIEDQVREPLDLHGLGSPQDRRAKAARMLEAVKLGRHLWRSVPSELSGGQQQRVVIARALILEPELLICDEPVSALDVSIQAQIITLLVEMRDRLGLAMIFISHDLAVVREIADRVAVMYLGEIVEEGPVEALFACPMHPYTKALLSAVPVPDPAVRGPRRLLDGEPPSPQMPPNGCRFHPRCPKASDRCRSDWPSPRSAGPRRIACHFPETAP